MTGMRLVGGLLAASLVFSSTAATAAAPVRSVPVSPWALLTVMSEGAPAAALCGAAAAAAAAAQPTAGCVLPALDAPPPIAQAAPQAPAPVPPISASGAGFGLGISPLLLGLLAVAAGIGIYFAVHHHGNSPS